MLTETDLHLDDGRTLHVYDRAAGAAGLPVVWMHGTPNVGPPPAPLFAAADRLGLRWLGYDRPGYGGSTRRPGRDVASAAADVRAAADALGIEKFAVMSHSGGGPAALACAALLPERVSAAVVVSGMAPLNAEGLDWFAGIAAGGQAELRAAVEGAQVLEAVLEAVLESSTFDPDLFVPADLAALGGAWSWFDDIVARGLANGRGAMVDDDVANVRSWGFDLAQVRVPVLFVHGEKDRMVPASHSAWLAGRLPGAELWLRPDDGHISVLNSVEPALEWLTP